MWPGSVISSKYLLELRSEILVFGLSEPFELFKRFTDEHFLQRLAYLADIFAKFNELNLALQGKNVNVFFAQKKIASTKEKLELWKSRVEDNDLSAFSTLKDFLEESDLVLEDAIQDEIVEHLAFLRESFDEYFPRNDHADDLWIQKPFTVSVTGLPLTVMEAEQLIDIRSSGSLQAAFDSSTLSDFWASVHQEFPAVAVRALRRLVPFVSTYLCETAFSTYMATETKYRNRLNAEDEMRLQLSEIVPDIAQMAKEFHHQVSH